MRWSAALVLGVSSLAACAGQYVYKPEEKATAQVSGRIAAQYSIPPEAPQGDVRVASFGISNITPAGVEPKEKVRAFHLRMVAENNSALPWTIDTREQLLSIEGQGKSRPAFASTSQGTLPLVQVPPRDKRTIDLFYPLPATLPKGAKQVPEFDALWTVQTGTKTVVERTPFIRLRIEPVYASAYDYNFGYWPEYGLGPYPWFNPLYPNGGFVNAVRLPPVFINQPVVIGRPTWR